MCLVWSVGSVTGAAPWLTGGDATMRFLHCWPSAGWAGFTQSRAVLGLELGVLKCVSSFTLLVKLRQICLMFQIVGVVGITFCRWQPASCGLLVLLMRLLPVCGTKLMASFAHRVVLFWVLLWFFLTCRKCFVTKNNIKLLFPVRCLVSVGNLLRKFDKGKYRLTVLCYEHFDLPLSCRF